MGSTMDSGKNQWRIAQAAACAWVKPAAASSWSGMGWGLEKAISGRPPDLVHPPEGCRFAPRCPYAQDRCHAEEPDLVDDGDGHLYRCWYPVGIASEQTTVDTVVAESHVREEGDELATDTEVRDEEDEV